jgi:hypothetical protein
MSPLFLSPQSTQQCAEGFPDDDINPYVDTVRVSPVPSVRIDSTSLMSQSTSPDIERATAQMVLEDHNINAISRARSLSPSMTWPVIHIQQDQMHTGSKEQRERSTSQPERPHYLDVRPLKRARTTSMTTDGPRPSYTMDQFAA